MRVAIVSPPWFPVPPTAYGGIESVVHLLVEGLARAGVDVTLFASGDSRTSVPLRSVYEVAPSEHLGQSGWELPHVLAAAEAARDVDVVHDHSGALGLAVLALAGARVLHTVHGPLTGRDAAPYDRIVRLRPDVALASLSLRQRAPRPRFPWLANIPNAVDLGAYPVTRRRDDYLLFLGRMSPEKGAHRAIEVARLAGRPLRIAAKCRDPEEHVYFEREVAPLLGNDVEWLGEVSAADKVGLLRHAAALVFPIAWEEPFGLVMIEAAACGTPVLATRRGSVPEVVRDGVTGFVVDDHRDLAALVPRLARLDPDAIRADAERRFGVPAMVDRTIAAYETLARRGAASRPRVRAAPATRMAGEPLAHEGSGGARAAGATSR